MPTSSGAQNSTRYAYFANQHRLAVDTGGDVWVYDTLDHQIGGFSQQQGGSQSLTFSSQRGPVNVASLPVVYRNGIAVPPGPPAGTTPAPGAGSSASAASVYEALEQLASLKSKGILTEQEYTRPRRGAAQSNLTLTLMPACVPRVTQTGEAQMVRDRLLSHQRPISSSSTHRASASSSSW